MSKNRKSKGFVARAQNCVRIESRGDRKFNCQRVEPDMARMAEREESTEKQKEYLLTLAKVRHIKLDHAHFGYRFRRSRAHYESYDIIFYLTSLRY